MEARQVRTLNVSLEVGAAQQTVEVRATANAVETGKSATGAEISPVTIQQAPLFARNIFTGLVTMAPGLTGTGATTLDNYTPEVIFSIFRITPISPVRTARADFGRITSILTGSTGRLAQLSMRLEF